MNSKVARCSLFKKKKKKGNKSVIVTLILRGRGQVPRKSTFLGR